MDTLYTSWENIMHYKIKSVHFGGLLNSATKFRVWELRLRVQGFGVGAYMGVSENRGYLILGSLQ